MSSEHYVWAVDGKPISVHLSADVARELESRLPVESLKREDEIGGFLLGRVRQVNDSWIVAVDAIEPAVCHHSRGPSWTLTRADREVFAKQARKLSKRGVVGWFRTHTRPGLFLDQYDFDLFREFFAHPSAIALAIRPDAEAGFFFWENGEIQRTRPYRTFTCKAEALRFGPKTSRNLAEPPQVARAPRPVRKELLWLPVAVAIALAIFWNPSISFSTSGGRSRTASAVDRPVFAPPPQEETPLQSTASVRSIPPVRQPQPSITPLPPVAAPATPAVRPSPPEPVPQVLVKAEPPKANVFKRAVGSIPGLGFLKKTKSDAMDAPPVATRRVQPTRFDEPYAVRVKVKIGRDGYVKSAYLLTGSASAATAQSVMRAARGWRFTPARQENRPVESEMVLTFEPERGSGSSL